MVKMAISGLLLHTRGVGDARNAIKATSGSSLHVREVGDMGAAPKCNGSTPGLLLHARKVEMWWEWWKVKTTPERQLIMIINGLS